MNAPAALLAISVILLLVHIFLQAFLTTRELGRSWNAGPRDGGEAPKSVYAGRAMRASVNFRETYPAFLALMLLGDFAPNNIMLTVAGGSIWVIARIIYIPLYLLGIPYIRSIVWLISILGLVIMLVAAFWSQMMAPYFVEWSTLMAVFAIAAITPGADFALILRQSLVHGREAAFATAFGIGAALLFHVSYTILGLGLLISKSLILFNVVKWLGVLYLLYIGIKSITSRGIAGEKNENGKSRKTRQSLKKAFFAGFTVNALNPKAVFFFLSIFSTFVAPVTPIAVKFCYGLSMSALLIGWFVLVGIFMTTPAIRSLYQRAAKWIDRLCGAVFIAFSIRLMFQKAS